MQHSDERPPSSGRPSLLSLDQQAEADRHRILSSLESKPAATSAGAEKSRKAMVTWLVAGAAVLALAAGAGLWLVSEGEKEIVLAGTAPLPSEPAPAAALSTDPSVMRGTADEVPAAAILNDTPVLAGAPGATPSKKQADDALSKMLEESEPAASAAAATPKAEQPAAVAGKSGTTAAVGDKAPARPLKPVRTAAKPPAKKAGGGREEASNVAPRPRVATSATPKKKADVKPAAKPAAPVDSDVALLAALVAHSKATQPKSTGAAAKLRQCKSLGSVAEANQCRARVCAGAKGEPECKASGSGKAPGG